MAYAQVREITIQENGRVNVEGLRVRTGDRVQVVVIPRPKNSENSARYPLHGHPIQYAAPFDPASDPDDWEVNR